MTVKEFFKKFSYKAGYEEGFEAGRKAGYEQGLHDGNPFIWVSSKIREAIDSVAETLAEALEGHSNLVAEFTNKESEDSDDS